MYFFICFTIQSSHTSQESSHSQESDYIDNNSLCDNHRSNIILISSIESQCLFYQLLTNFVKTYYCFSQLQTATKPRFRVLPKLRNRCVFQTRTRDVFLPKHSFSNHMCSVEAPLFNLQLYAIQSCLIGQISCKSLAAVRVVKLDTSESEGGQVMLHICLYVANMFISKGFR